MLKRNEGKQMKNVINSNNAPDAIGPYSQAIETDNLVFVSGQLPVDKNSGTMPEGIKNQTYQSLTNIKYILEAAGLSMNNIVKTTVLLQNIADFSDMNEIYATFFKDVCPARAAFEVAALPKGALVEIEAIAVK